MAFRRIGIPTRGRSEEGGEIVKMPPPPSVVVPKVAMMMDGEYDAAAGPRGAASAPRRTDSSTPGSFVEGRCLGGWVVNFFYSGKELMVRSVVPFEGEFERH
ncbi:hypothetical protein ACJRO7_019847 [Eucalyptus globulus]|uniref:Uncharacterized protein n=1 Tax=Eucalyptus globulus TaxID=34317 RepID=A0ABD3KEI1_EUCGL